MAREDELLPEESREGDTTTAKQQSDAVVDDAIISSEKEVKVIDRRRNSLAGKSADVRPRGGSFRSLSEAMGGFKQRLSRISLVSSDGTTATTASSGTSVRVRNCHSFW